MAGINNFNGYTYPYQYPLQGQLTVPSPNVNQPQSSLIWVEGEVGANAYPVAKGNTILLLDSTSTIFYLKSVDLLGNASLRKFNFEEIIDKVESKTEPKKETNSEFTMEDVMNKIENSINGLANRLDDMVTSQLKFEKDTVEQMQFMEDKINRMNYGKNHKHKENKE